MINSLRSFRLNNNLLLLIFAGGIIMYRLLICINYTPEISVGETNNIWNALNVANGRSMYCNPEDTPFEIFQYTPLSQFPIVVLAKMYNSQSPNYYYNVLVSGRILSLMLNILTFYLIFLLLFKRLKIDKTISLAAAVAGFGLLTHLAFAVRPDALSLCLTILSVYIFSIAYFEGNVRYLVFSGLLFALSFFAKQDSFLILSALGLCLLIQKQWKSIMIVAFSFLSSFGVFLMIFYFIFGKYFFLSIIGGLAQGYSLHQAFDVFERFLHFYSVWFYLGLFCSYIVIKRAPLNKMGVFVLSLSSMSFCIALSTSFKFGSWINYYTQYIIYTVILIYYVVDLVKTNKQVIVNGVTYFTIITVSFFVFFQVMHYTSPFLKYSESKSKHEVLMSQFSNFKKKIEATNQLVFTFDKQLKLFFYKNTLFPNTEYYHHSLFSTVGYNNLQSKKKLSFVLLNNELGSEQLMTLNYYKIDFTRFEKSNDKLNYSIYEFKR